MTRVVIIHPDLGIGGAERLIVDAAKALQDSGHHVRIYTGYHDKDRCFEETRDGTLETFTVGDWIPRSIFGRFHALMAYLKMIFIAFHLLLYSEHDLVLCDQVPTCIPILRLNFKNPCKIIFYCHFPDQLLTERKTILKLLYRWPIDRIEEMCILAADKILVNSNFTGSVARKTFTSLRNRTLEVLFPCVDVKKFENCKPSLEESRDLVRECKQLSESKGKPMIFLSLNRFERKKDLGLAIEGFSKFLSRARQAKVHLIVAGGYDSRLSDCVQYYKELESLVDELRLIERVTFIKSPSENEKLVLLQLAHVVIYTPWNEHFGIVPLEAMAMSKPVIATASGGPLETVKPLVNGLSCDCTVESFAWAIFEMWLERTGKTIRMGESGLSLVKEKFSYEAFRDKLEDICNKLMGSRQQ